MTRLAYIVTRSHHGGAQAHVAALIGYFRHIYDVHLATGDEGYLTEVVGGWGVPVTIIPHLRPELSPFALADDMRAGGEIWRWLGEIRPAILHAHSSKAGGLGRYAARFRGIPTVFTAHGWAFTEGVPRAQKLVMLPAEWCVSRVTDSIITVSQADHDLARRFKLRPRRRLVTIHNGIGQDAPSRSLELGSTVHLVCVARFSPQKHQSLLVRALAAVAGDWRLTFVGEGPLENDVQQLARENGLGERIEFLGARDDVAEILARSDIFVLPSNWEGFPLTILEAMRAGLPVIASDVGGVREAVADGDTGYLIPRGDARAWSERLSSVIQDSDLRTTLGERARETFLEQFVETKMFARVHKVYSEIEHANAG